jgi:isocitrate dehydrogenase kinase/phosphatase
VITEREDVAQVFGFTRAYFHADLPTVGDAVVFLRTLLPRKPVNELFHRARPRQAGQDRALPGLLFAPRRSTRTSASCMPTASAAW